MNFLLFFSLSFTNQTKSLALLQTVDGDRERYSEDRKFRSSTASTPGGYNQKSFSSSTASLRERSRSTHSTARESEARSSRDGLNKGGSGGYSTYTSGGKLSFVPCIILSAMLALIILYRTESTAAGRASYRSNNLKASTSSLTKELTADDIDKRLEALQTFLRSAHEL